MAHACAGIFLEQEPGPASPATGSLLPALFDFVNRFQLIDCITISQKQFEYTKKRIFKNGLNNKVNVKFMDYRDLNDKYNKIASIEMIEAVGDKYMNSYFGKIKDSFLLKK